MIMQQMLQNYPVILYAIAGATQDSLTLLNQPYAVLLNKNGKIVNSEVIVSPVTAVANAVIKSANGNIAIAVIAGLHSTIHRMYILLNSIPAERSAVIQDKEVAATDTADLVEQTVAVTNLIATVSTGAETAAEQARHCKHDSAQDCPGNAKQTIIAEKYFAGFSISKSCKR